MRLSDAERKVMELVWDSEGITAKELAQILDAQVGWKKTTTYTMISVCIKKGYLRREEPRFQCFGAVTREQVAEMETDTLLANNYYDRPDLLIAALVSSKRLSMEQLEELSKSLRELEQ